MNLSVVIPIKDERDNLRPLHEQLRQHLDPLGLRYEIVFVDDGSSDGSFAVLQQLAQGDPLVKVVRLRRNFGQTAALQAGIDWSKGDVLVTMDGDLQNDPADIPRLLAKLDEGYDAVLGLRAQRQDNLLIRKIPSLIANWLIRKVTGVPIRDLGCTLRAMRRDLAESLPLYGEMHRFVAVLAQQSGGHLAQIPVRHHPRRSGKTKYNLTRTFRVILDLITIKFLDSYLTRPMHIMGLGGLIAMSLGVVSLIATIWMKSRYGLFMTGNPLLLLSVMLELVGVQLISMGLLGELLSRTYFESQGKTAYAVRSTLNLDPGVRRRPSAGRRNVARSQAPSSHPVGSPSGQDETPDPAGAPQQALLGDRRPAHHAARQAQAAR
ncbi:MAG: glycosyltransferase family 2 protein [Gemmataceae bacterium]|nr:glycosyltransferase family 2 protein [Gemmataceae bacterium]MDW8263823.1 glycosyltransferase family 2 protein [Gemmataceae bacterium]